MGVDKNKEFEESLGLRGLEGLEGLEWDLLNGVALNSQRRSTAKPSTLLKVDLHCLVAQLALLFLGEAFETE